MLQSYRWHDLSLPSVHTHAGNRTTSDRVPEGESAGQRAPVDPVRTCQIPRGLRPVEPWASPCSRRFSGVLG